MVLTPLLSLVVLLVGILIGSVGIGGVLLVPSLKFLGDIPLHIAIPACMLSYIATGSVGALIYARHGTINWSMATKVCLGALPGAYLGAFLLPYIRAELLEVFIALLILASGTNALRRHVNEKANELSQQDTPLLLIGAVSGLGSALSGTGGPLVLIPILIWCKLPVLTAIGLSQVIQIPISASASVGNFIHGQLDLRLALVLAITMIGGTIIGARIAHHLPAEPLKKFVACLLIIIGLMMLARLLL